MNLKILTIEQLKQLEERLYDLELDGEDVGLSRTVGRAHGFDLNQV